MKLNYKDVLKIYCSHLLMTKLIDFTKKLKNKKATNDQLLEFKNEILDEGAKEFANAMKEVIEEATNRLSTGGKKV